jgi:hypothetical protein
MIGQNKQLEALFDLPPTGLPDAPEEVVQALVEQDQAIEAGSDLQQKVETALPQVTGINFHDGEMDDIAAEAMQTYKDIKDLAMNVEARHAAELLSVAAGLLQTALDAKTKKTDTKLRTVSLQLQALRTQAKQVQAGGMIETQGAVVGNRNQIMASLQKK